MQSHVCYFPANFACTFTFLRDERHRQTDGTGTMLVFRGGTFASHISLCKLCGSQRTWTRFEWWHRKCRQILMRYVRTFVVDRESKASFAECPRSLVGVDGKTEKCRARARLITPNSFVERHPWGKGGCHPIGTVSRQSLLEWNTLNVGNRGPAFFQSDSVLFPNSPSFETLVPRLTRSSAKICIYIHFLIGRPNRISLLFLNWFRCLICHGDVMDSTAMAEPCQET